MYGARYFPLKKSSGDFVLFEHKNMDFLELDFQASSPYNLGQIFYWINNHAETNNIVSFRRPAVGGESSFDELLQTLDSVEIKQFMAGARTLKGPYYV